MTENLVLKAGNEPTEEGKVVISFLGDNYLAGSVIDLGVHLIDNNKINNQNVNCIKYENINDYKFIEKGFQTLEFDENMMQ